MPISRRILLAVGGATIVAPRLALAQGSPSLPSLEARMAERSLGKADAPVVVTEWFSLTCPHCAAFHQQSLPGIRTQLIETGKCRLVFRDFPLDRAALYAAMVARALPAERYEPFVSALFASQDRWAFNRQANPVEELAKLAALAGMNRETFNAVIADQAFSAAILKGQEEADKTYKVDSTPSFIFNGPKAKNRKEAGGRTPDDFAKLVAEAAG